MNDTVEQMILFVDFQYLASWVNSTDQDLQVRKALAWKVANAMATAWNSNLPRQKSVEDGIRRQEDSEREDGSRSRMRLAGRLADWLESVSVQVTQSESLLGKTSPAGGENEDLPSCCAPPCGRSRRYYQSHYANGGAPPLLPY